MATQLNNEPVFGQFGNDAEEEQYSKWFEGLTDSEGKGIRKWGLLVTADTRGQCWGVLSRFRKWLVDNEGFERDQVQLATRKAEGTGFRGFARIV